MIMEIQTLNLHLLKICIQPRDICHFICVTMRFMTFPSLPLVADMNEYLILPRLLHAVIRLHLFLIVLM